MLWLLGGILAVANVAGSYLGSRMAISRGTTFIRVVFLVVVVALIAKLGVDVWNENLAPSSPSPLLLFLRRDPGYDDETPGCRRQCPGVSAVRQGVGGSGLVLGCEVHTGLGALLGVIGAGAEVSGSKPLPDFGKAMTSRIDSVLVRCWSTRSMPSAMPPCGERRT